jgi:putative aldouronate transport system permease protein
MDRLTPADFVIAGILLLIAFLCLTPIWHVAAASFSQPAQIEQTVGVIWRPKSPTLRGYELVFRNPLLASGYMNTIIYVAGSTALGLLLTLLGGYLSSRRNAIFAKPFTFMVTFTMFFSGGLIPFYLVVNGLGWVNTRWALIIPGCLSAYNLIVMRTALKGVPGSMEESARIDGAGDFTVLFRILVPLCAPVFAVLGMYYAVGAWNSWFNAMIFLQKRPLFPLQLILREILVSNEVNSMISGLHGDTDIYRPLVKYCAIVVATAPILAVYPFIQRYFIKGVMVGAIKG